MLPAPARPPTWGGRPGSGRFEDTPRTRTTELSILRQATHDAPHFACWNAAVSATVRGADGHVAAYWVKATNRWMALTAQAHWVDRCFHANARERRRRP